MKKLISKSKKVVAVFLLAIMVVCAVAPSVQAYSFSKSGARDGHANDWYSKTEVSAYTDNGVAAKATAGASMPDTKWSYNTRTATAYVESAHTATKGNARHSYGIDGTIFGEWTAN